MRILSVLVFSLLVAGPALAGDGSDRWGKWEHSSKWQTQSQAPDAGADHPNTDHQADKWADYQLQLSAKLEKMDGKPGVRRGQQPTLSGELNSGVCDGLADATPGLQQLCVAFCELQDCRPDFSLENPYENCSASSTAVLDSYQTRRGAGDPDMPCVQQPDESAECPCWSRNELAELRSPLETDVFQVCFQNATADGYFTNFDTWHLSAGGSYETTLSTTEISVRDGGVSTCSLVDDCADGSCLQVSRDLVATPAQFAACEADLNVSAMERFTECTDLGL